MRTERSPKPDSFLSQIVVVPIKYPSAAERADTAQATACRAAGQASAQAIHRDNGVTPEYLGDEVISLPSGPACVYTLHVASASKVAVGAVLQSAGGDRSVACILAIGDTVGRAGCTAFLQSWAWVTPSTK